MGISGAALLAALSWLVVFWIQFANIGEKSLCYNEHGDLLTGYKILRYTLRKESQLKYLRRLRQATFRAPCGEVDRLMKLIFETSTKRGQELDRLWQQQDPIIDTSKTPVSVIGDTIQNTAEAKGAAEMVAKSDKSWSTRFYFLQAQATR